MLVSRFNEEITMREEKNNNYNVRLINGRVSNRKFVTGYCCEDSHRGYLTDKLEKTHHCAGKECPLYYDVIKEFNESSAYKKTEQKKATETKKELWQICCDVMNPELGMKVLDLQYDDWNIVLKYVAICSVELEIIKATLRERTRRRVTLNQLKCDYDHAVEIFMK